MKIVSTILLTIFPLLIVLAICAISILITPKHLKDKTDEPNLHP